MLTSRQQVFRKFWHAVMPLGDLHDGTPKAFTLLGEAIVLFLDANGQPAALKDRCCHRTARLSKGRCVNGALQCGYHGWTYNAQGRVIRIPQYPPEREIPSDYATPAYRCQAKYGYVWVALVEPIAAIPDIPEFEAPGWRTIFQFYERWATSPLRALENSFDNAHFSFVHRATFGVAAQPQPSRYELVDNPTGFYAETVVAASNPIAFQRAGGHAPSRHRVFDGQRPARDADPQEADGAARRAWRGRGARLMGADLLACGPGVGVRESRQLGSATLRTARRAEFALAHDETAARDPAWRQAQRGGAIK